MTNRNNPVGLLLILALCLAPRFVASAQPPGARIQWSDLPAEITEKAPDLRTGYLIVPERRQPVQSRRMIRLPFIIMKSRNPSPHPDPVLFTAGGPGGSSLGGVRGRLRNPLLDDRDVILLEQRGTRYAEPALVCPQIEKAFQSGWNTRLNGDPNPRDLKRAMATALRELRVQGVDLAGYTTKESAADIADLRRLLEIPSWNLYGVSYSTKLMLIVLRDHPEGIRAVILDSLLPPEVNWDEEAPGNILGTLDQVLRAWQDDPQAGAKAAGLKSRFLRLLGEANQHSINLTIKNPVNGTAMTLRLNGAGVMNCVYAGLESVGLRRRLPLILDAACRGEIGALAPLAESYLGSSLGSANGMRYAIWCNEEFPFERKAKMLAPGGLPAELRGFVQTAIPIQALTFWPKGRPDPLENEPVKSAVPIMIASGEFDPDTPTKWATQAAAFLPKAQVLVFAGMSHVPLFTHPEAGRLMRAFLEEPLGRLDPGTISIRPPFLLTLDPK